MDLNEWYRQAVLNRIALKAALRDLDRLESMLREHTHGAYKNAARNREVPDPTPPAEVSLGEGDWSGDIDDG